MFLAGCMPATWVKKGTALQMISHEFCEGFKTIYSTEHLRTNDFPLITNIYIHINQIVIAAIT